MSNGRAVGGMETVHCYRAYGVSLHSVLPLPELLPSEGPGDVYVRYGQLNKAKSIVSGAYYRCWQEKRGTYLYWPDVATFLVSDGQRITIDRTPGVEASRLRLILLGAVFSIVLQQRGLLVFHASALRVENSGTIFVGNKGWGKSTLASTLHQRGHEFLADDVVGVDDRDPGEPTIVPAFPQIKLWSETITSLGGNPLAYPKVSSIVDKRDCRLGEGFLDRPVPLKCIFVLGTSIKDIPEITELGAQEALIYLIAQSYNARWGKEMFAKNSAINLKRCEEIVTHIPVYSLARPRNLRLLAVTAKMIEDHLRKLPKT